MISIRRKLIVTILGTLLVSTTIMSTITYFSAKDEIKELFDENMKQIALALSNQDVPKNVTQDPDVFGRRGLRGEEEFLVQIWRDQKLEYTSLPAIGFGRQTVEGYGHDEYQGDKWYFFALKKNGLFYQVAQPADDRNALFLEVYYRLLLPILVQLPMVAFLVSLLVRQGLMPLRRVSTSIQKRNPDFLEPLPLKNVPVEIGSMVDALNKLLNRLSDALKLQRRFTADAAHELRTPLTAVKLQLDLLARARNDEDRKEALDVLSRGVDRSIRLVEQLLSLARQDPEGIEHPWTDIQLNKLLHDVVLQHEPIARNRNITIKSSLQDNLVFHGQSSHLFTMIGNLVSNAIIYTPKGGEINISLIDRSDYMQFDVADTGIGISTEEQERIFDRFYRVKGSKENGSGLGLSIVKSVADKHGINISVYSGPDAPGTLFRLIFPK